MVKNNMIISEKHRTMVGQQYTPEQRNCMAMAYERNKENFKFMNIIKAVKKTNPFYLASC